MYMAQTPEAEPQTSQWQEKPELTPRVEVPTTPGELEGVLKPVQSDQPNVVLDDTGQSILEPVPGTRTVVSTMTMEEENSARKAPITSSSRWLAGFLERARKMGIKIIHPTHGWQSHPSRQAA